MGRLQDFVTAMDPVVSQMFPNNSMWMSVKDGVMLGAYVTDLLAGNSSNATTGEFMKSVGVFIHDIQKAFNGLSPEVIQTLDAFSTVDWPHLWHLLSTATLDNQTYGSLYIFIYLVLLCPLRESRAALPAA